MGSQTLEILRQGVWASLTGGWFYDPHQDVFCNTFHLYVWLFLLCLPFTIYVYFPPTEYMWYMYCAMVTVSLMIIKLVNYGLHHMYDTTECIHEQVEDEWTGQKREEEGIELQVLNKTSAELPKPTACGSLASYTDASQLVSTDVDSIESNEYHHRNDAAEGKQSSTIDLKAEVHRKNSSESSEEISMPSLVDASVDRTHYQNDSDLKEKTIKRQSSLDTSKSAVRVLSHQEAGVGGASRRHSNFTNSSLSYIPNQGEMKQTGSLELGYIDKNNSNEGFYFKSSRGVRRIRSTALETCCPPPTLTMHPNSLEIIGGGGAKGKNPLPPPSTSLIRNQHLNLCPYYGSEIVYPIAEQSDEHQTSHGPDTDVESLTHISDSDYEENNRGSRSPLLLRIQHMGCVVRPLPLYNLKLEEPDRTSATSKDALLDNSNSNSNSSPEMEIHQGDFIKKDDNNSDLSCSNTSVEFDDEGNMKRSSTVRLQEIVNDEAGAVAAAVESPVIKRKNAKKNRKRKLNESFQSKEAGHCSSLVELDLDWLFDDENEHLRHCKDSGKRDTATCSRTAICLEQDVSKVLQETVPANRNLGAIPKKVRHHHHQTPEMSDQQYQQKSRKIAKSESDRYCNRRITTHHKDFSRNRSVKETQTINLSKQQNDSSVEGLECLVNQPRLRKLSVPRRSSKTRGGCSDGQEASSSSSNNELSTLLPAPPLLQAFLVSRREFPILPVCLPGDRASSPIPRHCRLKRSGVRNRHRGSSMRRAQRGAAMMTTLSSGQGTHLASSFNDTSNGSVHSFQDEHGNWVTYTFDEKGIGTANSVIKKDVWENQNNQSGNDSVGNSSVSIIMDAPVVVPVNVKTITTNSMIPTGNARIRAVNSVQVQLEENSRQQFRRALHRDLRQMMSSETTNALSDLLFYNTTGDGDRPRNRCRFIQAVDTLNNNYPRTKSYYKLKLFPCTSIKVTLDRLKLMALLDRNLTFWETLFSAFLGSLVSVLGAIMLYLNFYDDLTAFIFCFIIASSQYSLLKSVQPDAASPTHGFNRVIAYSRPIYFCIFSSLVLILHLVSTHCEVYTAFTLYGIKFTNEDALTLVRDFLIKFILFFPLLFSLGLFPQINTFVLYVFEQIDMHFFGGNAICSLTASFYCIFRSILAVIVIYGFAYGGLCEPKTSQHILFSIFCACLTSCSYHLSRSASDPSHVWNLLKKHLWPPDIYKEHNKKKEEVSEINKRAEDKNSAKCEDTSEQPQNHGDFEKQGEAHVKSNQQVNEFEMKASNYQEVQVKNKPIEFEMKSETYNKNVQTSKDFEMKMPNNPDGDFNKSKPENVEFEGKMEQPNPEPNEQNNEDSVDPLPSKLQKTVNARLTSDVLLCGLIAILVFSIHASTVFTALQPELSPVLWGTAAVLGFLLHYIVPQMRKQLPWLCIARPVLRSCEHDQYQVRGPAKIMWFEKAYVYLCFVERNVLYPLLFLAALTEESPKVAQKFGVPLGALIVVVCGLKCLRCSYSDQSSQYLILTFTALFFKYDYTIFQESFLIDYFIMSIVYHKTYELLLKVQFVVTYIAPWQITWGSAFHAFAQPFSVPHSAMLFLQAFISAVLSTPLNPFLGSAIFLTSYVRPVKFWERDYNTRRVDHSNTPLSSHLERNLGADDNNLNSIFYEHLTRSLQHSLCGDLILGRWGPVNQGDCFVLASDYLNCLVHIIEMGNGLVSFQMRGLEFRGTYCQQREVEAITEGVEENDGCCCCDPGHLPNMLSVNAAFSQRWLAWEVTAAKYILEGYSISDNSAVSMLQVFDFRKVLVTYYVKSIIFYAVRSPKLEEWLNSGTILKALQPMQDRNFVDLDPVFNFNIDEDFDLSACGMTRSMFFQVYNEWISYCVEKSEKSIDTSINSTLVLLCFALSLLGRRTLGAASHNTVSNVEFFLYGLHALFKGDFRITCARDEWVFSDMDLLKTVVAPGVRMSLKLHQDHFMSPDEYEELSALYDAICKHEEELVISHEGDPAWRNAVLSGTPSLLALRHVLDEGSDEYKIIMLNKRYLSFRVIKINKECVRGLWAGQQQELVYLRNRNPERGSIQNAKQALRNIINSSCDQPIGYPIYVSPLTTSYAETNEQLCSLVGGSVSLGKIRNYLLNLFKRIRKRCGEGCSSGGSARDELGIGHDGVYAMAPMAALGTHTAGSQSTDGSHLCGSIGRGSSLSRTSLGGNRGSLASMGKPTSSTLASLAGLFKERDDRAVSQNPDAQVKEEQTDVGDKDLNLHRVRITDPNLVYDCINLGRRIDVYWPNEYMRSRGGRSHWRDWLPETGMEGQVVHKWIPCHKDPNRRSHVDRTILLVQIDDKFVPIAESGIQAIGVEV